MIRINTMNRLNEIIFGGILLGLIMVCSSVYGQGDKGISRKTISIGAQSPQSPHGSFADLTTGTTYFTKEVEPHQQQIDLVGSYFHGKVPTHYNLMMPSSPGIQSINAYKESVFEKWRYKNRGLIIVLKPDDKAKEVYESIETNKQLFDAYNRARSLVKEQTDYNKSTHGSSNRVRNLSEGDYMVIRSQDRGLYAIGHVLKLESGPRGYITIDFKVSDL